MFQRRPRLLDGDIEQWRKIKNSAVEAVLANGGTISHHLGVGQDHLPWIAQEKGQLGIDVLRAMKTSGTTAGAIVLSALTVRGGEMTVRAIGVAAFAVTARGAGSAL